MKRFLPIAIAAALAVIVEAGCGGRSVPRPPKETLRALYETNLFRTPQLPTAIALIERSSNLTHQAGLAMLMREAADAQREAVSEFVESGARVRKWNGMHSSYRVDTAKHSIWSWTFTSRALMFQQVVRRVHPDQSLVYELHYHSSGQLRDFSRQLPFSSGVLFRDDGSLDAAWLGLPGGVNYEVEWNANGTLIRQRMRNR